MEKFIIIITLSSIIVSCNQDQNESYTYFNFNEVEKDLRDSLSIDVDLYTKQLENAYTMDFIKDSVVYELFSYRDRNHQYQFYLEKAIDTVIDVTDKYYEILTDKERCFYASRFIITSLLKNRVVGNTEIDDSYFEVNLDGFFILDGIYNPINFLLFSEQIINSEDISETEIIKMIVTIHILKSINRNHILTGWTRG